MQILNVEINQAGYDENKGILREIRFSVNSGELVGLIGPNGAGKSTAIKAIIGLLKDMKGTIQFNGVTNYAYIPEQPIYYDELTLWEHLELTASVLEMDRQTFEEKANQLLEKFSMVEVKHHLPASFSKGMQQKLMIIVAFLMDPDLYIIDEPFIGLDPIAQKDLISLLNQEKEDGKAILMSTHVLDSAEKICDRFILLNRGQVIASGTHQEISEQVGLPNSSLIDCFYEIVRKQ